MFKFLSRVIVPGWNYQAGTDGKQAIGSLNRQQWEKAIENYSELLSQIEKHPRPFGRMVVWGVVAETCNRLLTSGKKVKIDNLPDGHPWADFASHRADRLRPNMDDLIVRAVKDGKKLVYDEQEVVYEADTQELLDESPV